MPSLFAAFIAALPETVLMDLYVIGWHEIGGIPGTPETFEVSDEDRGILAAYRAELNRRWRKYLLEVGQCDPECIAGCEHPVVQDPRSFGELFDLDEQVALDADLNEIPF